MDPAKKLDKAFNDIRNKLDFVVESCEYQNACMERIMRLLDKDSDNCCNERRSDTYEKRKNSVY